MPGVERVVRLGRATPARPPGVAVVGADWWHAEHAAPRRSRSNGRRRRPARSTARRRASTPNCETTPRTPTARLRLPRARRRRGGRAPAPRARSRRSIARRTSRTRRWSRSTARRASPTARSRSGPRRRCPAWRATIAARVAGVAERRGHRACHATSAAASAAGSRSTSSARRCASRSRPAAGRCSSSGRARRTSTHDFYRPAGVARAARRARCAGGSRSALRDHERRRRDHAALDGARPAGARRPGRHCPTRRSSEGLFDLPYGIAEPAHRARRDAQRRAGRLLALGRPFAQRVLRRVVHRRARRTRPAPDPVAYRLGAARRTAPRHAAVLRAGGAAGRLAGPAPLRAAGRARARRRAARELRQHRRAGRRGLARSSGRPRVHRVVCAADCRHASSTRASSRSRWKARSSSA